MKICTLCILTYSFPHLEPDCCSMSSSNCCFLTCIQISQRQVRWSGMPISLRIFHSIYCDPHSQMAPHSSALAWKIPWTEEPRGLQSMGSQRVRHNWAASLSLFTFMHWRRKWQPTPVLLPGESQGGGAWWAAICGVAQSRLKRLDSSSSTVKGQSQ